MTPTQLYQFLAEHHIVFERVDHPPVYTVAEAIALVPPLAAAETKNLLVRDRKGRRHFLVVVGYDKQVDLKELAAVLGVSKLGMASPERLMTHLGVEPGSVSLLAIIHDQEKAVEIVIDEAVWTAEALKCHPLVNTTTLAINRTDMEKIFQLTGHDFILLDVPTRRID
jgi:Ala-tRNA(Pro) deacylase